MFHGEERWRSEGVQVGGLQSARGIWGSWFDKDFDPEGPAGPTAFWKLTDDLPPTTDPRNGHGFHAPSHSHPILVNSVQEHHNAEQTLGSAAAVGLFGAAASTDASTDGGDDSSARVSDEFSTVLKSVSRLDKVIWGGMHFERDMKCSRYAGCANYGCYLGHAYHGNAPEWRERRRR